MWTNFIVKATNALAGIRDEDEGQTLVEYALIISLVSIALVVGLGLLATGIGGTFTKVIAKL